MSSWGFDLRLALRSLRRSPGFAAVVVLTLSLGIGAHTALFTALHALLLERLPFPDPERLLALYETTPSSARAPVSLLDFLDWEERLASFRGLGAWRTRSFGIETPGAGAPSVIQVGMATSGLLPALSGGAWLGRTFSAGEERAGAPVLVLGHRLWRTRFGGDRGILGRSVALNEEPRTVIGVLPRGMELPAGGRFADAYIPIDHAAYGRSRSARSLQVVARLAPGVAPREARAELRSVAAALGRSHPETNARVGADLDSLHEHLKGKGRRPLLLLLAATGLLLAVACVNVAALFTGRSLARRPETALRASLGGGPLRSARPLLLEGLVLSAAGTAAGLAVARGCLLILPIALPLLGRAPLHALESAALQLDWPTLLFAAVLCAACASLFGLVPALAARRNDPARLLRRAGTGSTRTAGGRRTLAAVQIAISLVLLLSAGLLARSLLELRFTDPGFDPRNVHRFGIGLPEARYRDAGARAAFHRAMEERLAAVPGVEAAAAVTPLPLGGRSYRAAFRLPGLPEGQERTRTSLSLIGPGYLEAMGIPLVAGRSFGPRDDADAPAVVLVNEAFREAWLPGRDPLGETIRLSWRDERNEPYARREIVGVVGDTRSRSLERAAVPTVYLPVAQFPPDGCSYVLRLARGDPAALEAAREEARRLDPALEPITLSPLASVVRRSLGDRRLGALLIGTFAGAALLLTAVGIYGAVALQAVRRRREMAIRMALGARGRRLAGALLGEGLRLTAAGIGAGLVIFLPASALIRDRLFGVGPFDPVSVLAVCLLLGLVALLAAAPPARSASSPGNLRRLREL